MRFLQQSSSLTWPRLSVVEAGSYSGAARQLGIDKTLLSRRVQTLEEKLGVRLLHRTTRRVTPTDSGRILFERVMSPLNETVAALSHTADARRVEGLVRVASFASLTTQLWVPIIRELKLEHAGLQLELRAEERFVNLVDEGIDFALRAGNMPDSSFSASRVCTWDYILCASPAWMKEHGSTVKSPEDVREHWLLYPRIARANQWTFERDGKKLEVRMGAAVIVDSGTVIETLLHEGVGVAAMPSYMVASALRSGELVRLLPRWTVAHRHRLWIVTPARAHQPTRVTIVIEAVRARLKHLAKGWQTVARRRP